MKVHVSYPKTTQAVMQVIATSDELATIKARVLQDFRGNVKVPGFRQGNVPIELVEKHVDATQLQSRFLEEAIEQLYSQVAQSEQLRVVDQPHIALKKFVPYNTLEFEATVPVISNITLPDYKKIKLAGGEVQVTAEDVKEVVKSLQSRLADKKDVDRAAKLGDQAWIDFSGVDDKGQAIQGATGKDYPLGLGSNSFIPGFEDNIIGLKAGDDKTFTLTFPKDYGAKNLAGKKVTFSVHVTKIQEVVEPKPDDAFAAKAGPFKTLAELKADIKKQLEHERRHEAERNYQSELIKKISDKTTVDIPEILIEDQITRLLQDVRQNVAYRGMTMPEFLEAEGKTEEAYKKDVITPQAIERTKASLVLAEIAEREKLQVSPEELELRMQALKSQYTDPAMQAELEKPEARRDIAARILTEKTVAKLSEYARS